MNNEATLANNFYAAVRRHRDAQVRFAQEDTVVWDTPQASDIFGLAQVADPLPVTETARGILPTPRGKWVRWAHEVRQVEGIADALLGLSNEEGQGLTDALNDHARWYWVVTEHGRGLLDANLRLPEPCSSGVTRSVRRDVVASCGPNDAVGQINLPSLEEALGQFAPEDAHVLVIDLIAATGKRARVIRILRRRLEAESKEQPVRRVLRRPLSPIAQSREAKSRWISGQSELVDPLSAERMEERRLRACSSRFEQATLITTEVRRARIR